MAKYIGKRLVTGILSLFVLATVTFFLTRVIPVSYTHLDVYKRQDPSCRGRRHQTGRKADVCDSSAYPAVCRNDPVLVFLVRKETKSWNICMAEIFILMKT